MPIPVILSLTYKPVFEIPFSLFKDKIVVNSMLSLLSASFTLEISFILFTNSSIESTLISSTLVLISPFLIPA